MIHKYIKHVIWRNIFGNIIYLKVLILKNLNQEILENEIKTELLHNLFYFFINDCRALR